MTVAPITRGRLFCVVVGPPFSRCDSPDCGALLVGLRCWRWREGGAVRYGCCVCGFEHALPSGAAAA